MQTMRPLPLRLLPGLLISTLLISTVGHAADSAADESNPWVARKGNSVVTLQDLDAQLDGLLPEIRAGIMNDPQRIEKMIEDLLLNRQLADLAREAGHDRSPLHAVKLKLAEDRFMSQEYRDTLTHNLNEQQLDQLAQERFLTASPSVFGGTDEKRDLQHILISYDGRSLVDARTLAQEVHARLLKGESFDQLAMTYSADKSRIDDVGLPKPPGLLTNIGRGETDPDFESVAFALKRPGELSEPVQSAHGFHIIKLLRIQPERRLPYAEVREAVVAETSRWLSRKIREDLVTDLRSLPVEGNKDVIATLPRRYRPQTEEATP